VRPVGSQEEYPADVRLIVATNRDLQSRVDDGLFREDLYHRIKVVPIALPPLRERLEDLPLLVEHFLMAHSRGATPVVTDEVLDRLRAHPWPGNVRELEMCLRVALVLCEGPRLEPEHLQIHHLIAPESGPAVAITSEADGPVDLLERQQRLLEEWPIDEPIRCSAYADRYDVPPRTASRDLAQLARQGYLTKLGAGRSTRYVRGRGL